MKKYTITKSNFLSWYFDSGQDSENASIREDLAESLINGLTKSNTFTITTEEVFEQCNKDAIKLCYLEEFYDEDEREVEDLMEDCEIILID